MAKVKGLRKLNKVISAEVAPFGISKAFYDTTGYTYYPDSEKIGYQITEGEPDEFLNDFIKERFGYTVENQFIISLLHEIGHHKNNDDIDGDVYEFCISEKERISNELAYAKNKKERRKLNYQYFNLPDEIMATSWAVAYAKKHPRKIKKMWKNCEKGLHDFYRINLLTAD